MDWIFDNLQIVLAVAAAFAYWLTQRKQAEQEEEERGADQEQFPTRVDDELGDEARARRIREEIRRKIAERSAGAPMPPLVAPDPPPLYRQEAEPPSPRPQPQPKSTEAPAPVRADEDPWKSVWASQQKLQDQMQALAETRRKAAQFTGPRLAVPPPQPAVAVALPGGSLRAELGDRDRLRRAIILREVLGPPVGLR